MVDVESFQMFQDLLLGDQRSLFVIGHFNGALDSRLSVLEVQFDGLVISVEFEVNSMMKTVNNEGVRVSDDFSVFLSEEDNDSGHGSQRVFVLGKFNSEFGNPGLLFLFSIFFELVGRSPLVEFNGNLFGRLNVSSSNDLIVNFFNGFVSVGNVQFEFSRV